MSGRVAACFSPRHGIRAVVGNETVDLVICFQCMQIEMYDEAGKRLIPTTRSPQPVLDRMLKEVGVPLARR